MGAWALLKQLVGMLAERKLGFFIMLGLLISSTLLLLAQPLLLNWLLGQLGGPFTDQERVTKEVLINSISIFIACIVVVQIAQAVISYLGVRLSRTIALNAANGVRKKFFSHLLRLPYSHFLDHSAGGQANTWLNDVEDIDLSINGFFEQGLRSALMIAVFAIVLTIWNPLIGLLAIVLMPLTVIAQRALRAKVRTSSRAKVDLRESMMGDLSEAVSNPNILKAFCLEPSITNHLNGLSRRYADNDIYLETTQSALRSSAAIILVFTQYGFFVIGAIQVIYDGLPFNEFIAQYSMLVLLTGPMNEILDYSNKLNQSAASLHRVDSLLNLEPEGGSHSQTPQDIPDTKQGIAVRISDLHFSYNDRTPIFQGFNCDIQAGETVAIVGASGSGKTTLFHLLLGFYEHYTGSIAFNNIDSKELELDYLRKHMGIVFQEQMLFNVSIRENLLIGSDDEDISEEAIWQALEQAHADEFVRQQSDGIETVIGTNGVSLSGGQRQRLSIARAILRNPPLLLLDEATSALDSISERHIQSALQGLFKNRTSIIIAHRLSTVTHADRILLVDEGRVIDAGPHLELLERSSLYRELYDAQVEGFKQASEESDD